MSCLSPLNIIYLPKTKNRPRRCLCSDGGGILAKISRFHSGLITLRLLKKALPGNGGTPRRHTRHFEHRAQAPVLKISAFPAACSWAHSPQTRQGAFSKMLLSLLRVFAAATPSQSTHFKNIQI